MKFNAMLIFFFFWHFLVYCLVAHWVWTVPGYLAQWGVRDFAGGYVIHIVAGLLLRVNASIHALWPRTI
jgi:Amt family ammonium transporter